MKKNYPLLDTKFATHQHFYQLTMNKTENKSKIRGNMFNGRIRNEIGQ